MSKTDIKYLALYLPQFHSIPENDEWWGKDFTEWTNVKSAKPYFDGHNQPRIPHPDIGYYNLVNDKDIMIKQANMAKKYGIYGFVYYYYWFDGRKLLQKPLEQMLKNERIDIPFCLFWANHNWTRSWDAGNKEILLEQKYNESSYTQFIDDLSPYFADRRYIRINGKPVLLVYQVDHIPDPKRAANIWREYAKSKYGEDLFLITIQQNNMISPNDLGYDAAMEGAPNFRASVCTIDKKRRPRLQEDVSITFYDYLLNAVQYIQRRESSYKLYRCVYPGFDNTPRRKKEKGWMFLGSTPDLFKKFLIEISKHAIRDLQPHERFVFINAWNEWAEGAYLEPDTLHGYSMLNACNVVSNMTKEELFTSGFHDQEIFLAKKELGRRSYSSIYLLGKIKIPFIKVKNKKRLKLTFMKCTIIRVR